MNEILMVLLPIALVWLIVARQRFDNAVRDAEHAERLADVGQGSGDPNVRGQSIGENISASRKRIQIFVDTLAVSVLPMLIASLAAIGTAIWMASHHL